MQIDKFEEYLKDIPEPKKSLLTSLYKDFTWLSEQIEVLRKYPRYIIDKKNPQNQKKLEVHNMIKDYQAQKDDIATKILKSLENNAEGESELEKALAEFE